jgi:hypothetical protein
MGGLELLLMLSSPSAINQRIVEFSQARRIDEPEELWIWRVLLKYDEELRQSIVRARYQAPVIARRNRRLHFVQTRGDMAGAKELEAEILRAFDAIRRACEADRAKLHKAIRARPAKSTPPRAILHDLSKDRMKNAVRAVEWYLNKLPKASEADRKRFTETAWSALLVVSTRLPIRYEWLDDYIAQGRSWLIDSNRAQAGRKALARYVVAKVAGLSPDARVLR